MSNECYININDVSLVYDLYFDKTNTLKEHFINLFRKRTYVVNPKEKLYALNNINISIKSGERIGIIGLNGAGKSTFLKVLSGLFKPTTGTIKIEGAIQPLIEIGAGFNPEFSGRENIYLNGAMLGFSKKQIQNKEIEIITFAELQDFIDVPVKYYSSGMIVRLAFSIATVIRPEILLLDEMLSAGDLSFIAKAKKRMDEILNFAKILILVSHDLGLIESITMRTLVFDKGEIVFDGHTPEAIDYYKNIVESKLSERKHDKELQKEKDLLEERAAQQHNLIQKAEEERISNIIKITNVFYSNCSRGTDNIYPDDEIKFHVNFLTKEDFDEFFLNLVINDGTGGILAHFRNDFSGVELKDFGAGTYQLVLNMQRTPFKSGNYKFYVRLVGKREDGSLVIKDYNDVPFKILGNKKQSNLIRHQWKLKQVDKVNEFDTLN